MYVSITAQKLSGNYAHNVVDFVEYLEKENVGKLPEEQEYFFNHNRDEISTDDVVKEIDGNTAKLKKSEPKFYSITLSPSERELKAIMDFPDALKRYVREVMTDYAKAFNREIDGKPVGVDDIKYFAKVEHHRKFKGTDREVRENQAVASRIYELEKEVRSIERGESSGNINKLQKEIARLEREAPYKFDGKRVISGMDKPGNQSHVHIIVSRKDASNRFSLSPGSKYKASETMLHGKMVKRGFDRDGFFKKAETAFDKMFGYRRNYVESYQGRKDFKKDPSLYYATIKKLPVKERSRAFELLQFAGVRTKLLPVQLSKLQLSRKAIHALKRAVGKAIESGSIGI